MSKMIDRVKAAIAEKLAPAIDVRAPYAKVMFEMAARAAIEAMREPSGAMVRAAHKTWFRGTDEDWRGTHTAPDSVAPHFIETWRCMINTALAD